MASVAVVVAVVAVVAPFDEESFDVEASDVKVFADHRHVSVDYFALVVL